MPPESSAELTAALRAQREDVHRQRKAVDEALATVRLARADGSADDEHDPDGPTLSTEWSQLTGLQRMLERESEQIERAQVRVTEGGFGQCLRCGRAIASERLAARPATEHCIDCARALEAR